MNDEKLMKIIQAPLVSEKSTMVADKYHQYVFRVAPKATKPEIRKAIELMFNVKVMGVQVCNIKGKKKRFGSVEGRRSNRKKAYVKLAEGHDIDFLGSQ